MNEYTPPFPTGDFTLEDGVALCKEIEPIVEVHGFHVALTGGTLYGEGGRKDIDLVFYRIRQCKNPDLVELNKALEAGLDMVLEEDYGFCKKYSIHGCIPLDVLFPEDWMGEYPAIQAVAEGDCATILIPKKEDKA